MQPFPQSVHEHSPNTITPRRSPLKFFLLVFALSVPFWLIGDVTGLQLLPGLPVSALALVCPTAAAWILLYRENRTAGVIELLKRSFDYRQIKACTHPSSDAWIGGRDVWADALDGGGSSNLALPGTGGNRDVRCIFHRCPR